MVVVVMIAVYIAPFAISPNQLSVGIYSLMKLLNIELVAIKAMIVADMFIAKSFQYLKTDSLKPREKR